MKTICRFAIVTVVLLSGAFGADEETKEPPVSYTLTVGDKEHAVQVDQPIEILGKFENPTVKLTASRIRTFSYGGLKFNYPSSFGWEAEVEPVMRTWTLQGNDLTIMIFAPIVALDLDSLLTGIKTRLGGKDSKSAECKRRFGRMELIGKKFGIDAFGHKLFIEGYRIETPKGVRLIVFQDSPGEEKTESVEGAAALKVICESFATPK